MTEMRTLRPGLLVSMNTSIKGNISYHTQDVEGTHVTDAGAQRAVWETTRTITDPAEHERAIKVRGKAANLIKGVCSKSAFGLLCPENRADDLRAAIIEARQLADEFNFGAGLTRISVNVIYGRIAQDDVEAVKAISQELRDLMSDMQDGLKNLDVKAVREAASKAKSVGEMLSDEAKGRLDVAISAARTSARQIVKAGEQVAGEIDRAAIAKIDMARTSFLDFDMASIDVAVPQASARAVELDPDVKAASDEYIAARAIDIREVM